MPHKSPLEGYQNLEPLPTSFNPDGKSLSNPVTGIKSTTYDVFPQPIDSSNNGFDFHSTPATVRIEMTTNWRMLTGPVYYMPSVPIEAQFAKELHERIRREFPEVRVSAIFCDFGIQMALELRIYRLWDRPIGPHPTAMFEVNTFNPHQTGAFFSWLTVNRGPCSYAFPRFNYPSLMIIKCACSPKHG